MDFRLKLERVAKEIDQDGLNLKFTEEEHDRVTDLEIYLKDKDKISINDQRFISILYNRIN